MVSSEWETLVGSSSLIAAGRVVQERLETKALSYIHHAIDDLLKEKQAKLHSPSDYEMHYDVVLPFKEDL